MDAVDSSSMVQDVLDSLDDLKISPNAYDEAKLLEVAGRGVASPEFVHLIASTANELALFHQLEERVTHPTEHTSIENFLFEISSLLTEFGCPCTFLTEGEMNTRLRNKHHCLTLLLFLLSELQAAKMYFFANPPSVKEGQTGSEEFKQLKSICLALKMKKPPDDIDAAMFMTGIERKIRENVEHCPPDHLSNPVIKKKLGPVHWEKLSFLNEALQQEYETRRTMLLKRLDVTIASFNWSDKAKSNLDGFAAAYQEIRFSLKPTSSISIAHLLAARDDISIFSKTSFGTTRQRCDINKVLMGNVPDRGGRTNEISAPLPEMPSWQKRRGGGHGDQRPGSGQRGISRRGQGCSGLGGYKGGGERPKSGGGRRSGGNWGRGRNALDAGSFERVFSHGGQHMTQGGFASGQHDYRS